MFESAELGHRLDKATFEKALPGLRESLLDIQNEVNEKADFPVIIIVSGLDGAGKGETVNLLSAWMDPRLIQVKTFSDRTDEERERPPMWRYWQALPPKGRTALLFNAWYGGPTAQRLLKKGSSASEIDQELENIVRFEHMLSNEGALIIKFWFHLSKKAQKLRLSQLEKNPDTRWRVTREDWRHYKRYDERRVLFEHVLRQTSTAEAPWIVVEGTDDRYRSLTVATAVLEATRRHLKLNDMKKLRVDAAPLQPVIDGLKLLDTLDLTQALPKGQYARQLRYWQERLNQLVREPFFKRRNLVLVFEGNDAAGKGGAIRRISAALDARQYQITPIAAPTEEERAQPYLWRFWRHIPRRGRVAIFDRSWYGRVLVERVEGFCSPPEWMRAYSEINDFEHQLNEAGSIVLKFWLTISREEQLARFNAREGTGYKRFKITPEDWRNRDKWDDYAQAVCDMVDRTSSAQAPWILVEANDKYFARIKILKTICETLESQR